MIKIELHTLVKKSTIAFGIRIIAAVVLFFCITSCVNNSPVIFPEAEYATNIIGNSDRPLEFGVLRKTFITRLTMAAGPNAKLFTGSSSDEVLKNHYLSTAYMAANLEDFTVL